jgi:signal transduction histidine kinase
MFFGAIQRWFHRFDQQSLNDALLEGVLGAVPAQSPSQPSMFRALCLMQRVVDEGRGAVERLRSSALAAMSLEQALSGIREEFTPGNGARLRIFVTGRPKTLQPAVQEQIYQIGREALVNALQHADASDIEAEVEYLPRRLRLVVRDNGCGMDPQSVESGRVAHWGLQGMRERAESIGAQLRIWSRPKAGTEVEISVPCDSTAEAWA